MPTIGWRNPTRPSNRCCVTRPVRRRRRSHGSRERPRSEVLRLIPLRARLAVIDKPL